MGVFIKRTRGLQTIKQVEAHVKYVGFRSREIGEDKGVFFDKNSDRANYKEFIYRIKSNKALKHPKSIKAQKLIFSLKQTDYDEYLKSGKDYKDLIRSTLKEYENISGVKLDWIASIHNKNGHPHVHVIIKAVSESKGIDGKYKRIFFRKEDFNTLKNIFNKEYGKEATFKEYDKSYTKEMSYSINKGFESVSLKNIGKGIEMLTNNIKRSIKREQSKSEYLKNSDINRKTNREKNNGRSRER